MVRVAQDHDDIVGDPNHRPAAGVIGPQDTAHRIVGEPVYAPRLGGHLREQRVLRSIDIDQARPPTPATHTPQMRPRRHRQPAEHQCVNHTQPRSPLLDRRNSITHDGIITHEHRFV